MQRSSGPGGDAPDGIYCATENLKVADQIVVSTKYKIKEIYSYGRLSGLHKNCWRKFLPKEVIEKAEAARLDEWWKPVRDNHINALQTGRDAMLEMQAQRFAEGKSFGGDCPSAK